MKQSEMHETLSRFTKRYRNEEDSRIVVRQRMTKFGSPAIGDEVASFALTNQGVKLTFSSGKIVIPSVKRMRVGESTCEITVYDQSTEKTAVVLENIGRRLLLDRVASLTSMRRMAQPLADVIEGLTVESVDVVDGYEASWDGRTDSVYAYRLTFTNGLSVVLQTDCAENDTSLLTFSVSTP